MRYAYTIVEQKCFTPDCEVDAIGVDGSASCVVVPDGGELRGEVADILVNGIGAFVVEPLERFAGLERRESRPMRLVYDGFERDHPGYPSHATQNIGDLGKRFPCSSGIDCHAKEEERSRVCFSRGLRACELLMCDGCSEFLGERQKVLGRRRRRGLWMGRRGIGVLCWLETESDCNRAGGKSLSLVELQVANVRGTTDGCNGRKHDAADTEGHELLEYLDIVSFGIAGDAVKWLEFEAGLHTVSMP